MDQIRFDFLNTWATAAQNRNATAPAEGADAFSQVLDQQLAQARDAGVQQDHDAPRPVTDRRRTGDVTDRQEDATQPRNNAGRRDHKTAAAVAPAKPKTAQKPAMAEAQSCKGKVTDAADDGHAAGETKSETADGKKDAAATAPAQTENGTPAKTDAQGQATGNAEQNGQQGQSEDDPSPQPQEDGDAVTDAGVAALMIPLPLQTIGTTVAVKGSATISGGSNAAALQAALLVAANLDAGALNLASPATTQAGGGKLGLKFGDIVPSATPPQAKAGADAAAGGGAAGGAASDPDDASPDPSAISAFPVIPKPQATSARDGATTRARSTATASSPVTAAYAGQSGTASATLSPVQSSIVLPWAKSNAAVESSDSLLPVSGTGISEETELSNWSQYLGSEGGAASAGSSTRAAAFLAQLKQNTQVPPHAQVAIQIQKAMQNGSNRFTLDLQPAELGRVEVKMEVDKDKNVTATVIVDRPATLDMLQRDAKALERALQDAGLQTNDGSLSFSLRNGNGQGGGSGANGQAGAGIGGGAAGSQASDAGNQAPRADVIATADGYVDVET